MDKIREYLRRSPWMGWVVAGLLLAASAYFYLGRGGGDPYSQKRLTSMVTIKYTDTGDEVDIPWGRVEKELRLRDGKLDPSKGLINPKTGAATGFPFSKNEWEEACARINREAEEIAARGKTAPADAKSKTK